MKKYMGDLMAQGMSLMAHMQRIQGDPALSKEIGEAMKGLQNMGK